MALKVPDEGEIRLLDMMVNGVNFTGVRLRLYMNDYTPVEASVYADFTQATFSGYAQVTPTFGAATTVSTKGSITDSSSRTFTHSGGATANTIYGYYVVDSGTNKVLWAERFSSSKAFAVVDDELEITLTFTGKSES